MVTTRPRKLRAGFWAGSTNTRKTTVKKNKGLTKIEKVETRKIAKQVVKSRKENKYSNSWYDYSDHDPATVGGLLQDRIIGAAALPGTWNPGVNSTTTVCFQTGTYLNSASVDLNAAFPPGVPAIFPLGGYSFPEGTGTDEIVGDFAFFNRSHISLEIKAEVAQGNTAGARGTLYPLNFRVLHLVARRDASGITPSLTGQMLLSLQNQPEGMNSSMTVKELMDDYTVNNFRFKKLREIRFKLNQPISPAYASTNTTAYQNTPTAHPFNRKIRLNCPMPKKKIRFANTDNGVSNAFEPLNCEYISYVIILCSRDAPYNTNGVTDFNDTGKDWSVYATGQTLAKDS